MFYIAVLLGASEACLDRGQSACVDQYPGSAPGTPVPQVPQGTELTGPYTGGQFEGTEHFIGVAIAMVTALLQQPANIFQES